MIMAVFYFTKKIFIVVVLAFFISYSHADDFSYPTLHHSNSDFGGVGLMQMPTARMHQEGELTLGASFNQDYYNYWLSLQLFPWLETTIRYTQIPDFLYNTNENFSGDTLRTDKGIDIKIRLLKESYWFPKLAIGLRDLGGTGVFDGEFIVANKQFRAIDFTLGLGWGYIGQRGNIKNPLCAINNKYCYRDYYSGYNPTGGILETNRLFKGNSAIFGGIEYQTPFSPLQLKLEYDGNDYSQDYRVQRGHDARIQRSPFNIGIVYQVTNWATANISYERGNMVSFGLSVNTNFNQLKSSWLDEPIPSITTTPTANQLTTEQWQQLAQDVENIAGYKNPTIYQNSDSSITVVAEQVKYRDRDQAQLRAGILLNNQAPAVEEFKIVETVANQPITETILNHQQLLQVVNNDYIGSNITDSRTTAAPQDIQGQPMIDLNQNWYVGIAPTLQQSLGGSEGFYMFNVGVTASADYWFNNHVTVGGSVYLNLYDTYDKFKYDVPPDGTHNKRVRTLVRQYITDNTLRMNNLQLTWLDQVSSDWYAQAYAGYLEVMFGGVGSEVLYRPVGSNWALGLDINYVKQRDPHSAFGFFKDQTQYDDQLGRPYEVQTGITTGNLTVYYQPQWQWLPNTLLKVSAGRYLAEDTGITIDFSKQFDSGIITGAFITKTNMSAEEYGEGSFNKGFYLSIPFDILTVKPSTNRANISWLPMTRDGGQLLGHKYYLYNLTDSRNPQHKR
ncbi:YjbH domain-containing protein [Photobacterium phosphoreum]|uniref:YjbH domain-containing protein n=2 Tax=Photobacterium phosphoreum TaxID=659 RepID=A0AAW4ZRU5_PHOPO|nr:YjbH domain-containing protein [Photobacterium phosphoreum]MCF2189990.1 YjbH domain-containing protein [Photobacterium phosphoreum]MCF2300801.1 YjbH domain-containing protein [Photobacterium phosphoreum]